jgi:hypothetical protein
MGQLVPLYTLGECWLKVQEDPRDPKVNFRGGYTADFRAHHSTAPPHVAGTPHTLTESS